MIRRTLLTLVCGIALVVGMSHSTASAQQQQHAYGQSWGGNNRNQDWERFYHYPYVYYPHNFYGNEYYRSSNSQYYRYVPEMRIPVYNKKWQNYYPQKRRYHKGHQFILDVF